MFLEFGEGRKRDPAGSLPGMTLKLLFWVEAWHCPFFQLLCFFSGHNGLCLILKGAMGLL